MRLLIGTTLLSFVAFASADCQSRSDFRFPTTFVDPSVKGHVIFSGLERPRSIKFDNANPANLLIVDVGRGVVALQPRDNCWEEKVLIENADFNHGLEYRNGVLYVSTSDTLLEYQYDPNSVSVSGSPRTLVTGMANEGAFLFLSISGKPRPTSVFLGHGTRTLLLEQDRIIINRGSQDNVDLGAQDIATGRSQLRRFSVTGTIPDGGFDWFEGELLAWGVRNAVAIALSPDGNQLWDAENSADELNYTMPDGSIIDVSEVSRRNFMLRTMLPVIHHERAGQSRRGTQFDRLSESIKSWIVLRISQLLYSGKMITRVCK